MAKKWEEILAERQQSTSKKRNYDVYAGDPTAKSRNIPMADEPWEQILSQRGENPYNYLNEKQRKDYDRPFYDFTQSKEQNNALQELYNVARNPVDRVGQLEDMRNTFKPKPKRPQENATLSNIPRTQVGAFKPIGGSIKERDPDEVSADVAAKLKNPMSMRDARESIIGDRLKTQTDNKPHVPNKFGDLSKVPQSEITATPVDMKVKNAIKDGVKTKSRAFIAGLTSPFTNLASTIGDYTEKDWKTGLYPEDGSAFRRISNWYTLNEDKLIAQGYTKKQVREMRKGDLATAKQEDKQNLLNASLDKPRHYQPTTGDQVANMAGSVAGNVAQALMVGQGVGALTKGLSPIGQAALTGGITEGISSFSDKDPIGDAAKDIARNALFFGAGRYGSDKVGQVAEELMFKYGLQNNVALEYARLALQGLGFDAAGYAATLPTYPMMGDQMPSAKEIGMDMAVGALFDMIPNAIETHGLIGQNKVKMDYAMNNLKQAYDYVGRYEKARPGDTATLNEAYDAMLASVRMTRDVINNTRIVGQEANVNKLNQLFDQTEVAIAQRKNAQNPRVGAAERPQGPQTPQRQPLGIEQGIRDMSNPIVRPNEVDPQGTNQVMRPGMENLPSMQQFMQKPGDYHIEPNQKMRDVLGAYRADQEAREQWGEDVPEWDGGRNPYEQQPEPTLADKMPWEQETKPNVPQTQEAAAKEPIQYGRSGKKAYTKWGENEWVNADLKNVNHPYTQEYTAFFDKWYESGRLGLEKRDIPFTDVDAKFPDFLQDAIFQAGKNDMPKGTDAPEGEAGPRLQTPILKEPKQGVPSLNELPRGNTEAGTRVYFKNQDKYYEPTTGTIEGIAEDGKILVRTDKVRSNGKVEPLGGKDGLIEVEASTLYNLEQEPPRDEYNVPLFPGEGVRLHIDSASGKPADLNANPTLKGKAKYGLGVVQSIQGDLAQVKIKDQTYEVPTNWLQRDERDNMVPSHKQEVEQGAAKEGIDPLEIHKGPDRYNGETTPVGPKGAKLINGDSYKEAYYYDAIMGKGYPSDPPHYIIKSDLDKIWDAAKKDFELLLQPEQGIIYRTNNAYNMMGRAINLAPGNTKFIEERKAAYAAEKVEYDKLDPKNFKFKVPEEKRKVEPPPTDRKEYVPAEKKATKEETAKVLEGVEAALEKAAMFDLEFKGFANSGDYTGAYNGIHKMLTKIKKSLLANRLYSPRPIQNQIEAYFEEHTKAFTESLLDRYKVPRPKASEYGIEAPTDIAKIDNMDTFHEKIGPEIVEAISKKRRILKAVKEDRLQDARYRINEQLTNMYLERTNHLIHNDVSATLNQEVIAWKKAHHDELIAEVFEKLGVEDPGNPQENISEDRVPIENPRNLKPGDVLSIYKDGAFEDTTVIDVSVTEGNYKDGYLVEVKAQDSNGMVSFIYPQSENVLQKVTQAQPTAQNEDEDWLSSMGFDEATPEVAATQEGPTKKAVDYEIETAKLLGTVKEDVYNYLKDLKNGRKASAYFLSEELAGVDGLQKLSSFIKFTKNPQDNKLDVLQMEMAHQFPEVEEMGLEEFGQYLVDAVGRKRENDKTIKDLKAQANEVNEDLPFEFTKEELEAASVVKPPRVLADNILAYIEKGQTFSPNKLYEMADKAFGGTQASGAYQIKDAYDAMELAVNLYIRQNDRFGDDAKVSQVVKNLQALEEVISKLPTQTKRSDRTDSYQQFSTPPTVACLAAYVANMSEADTVLEPSAGIGGLAIFAEAKGARVVTNELEPKRLEVLKQLGFEVFNLNAEQIDNLLPKTIKPSVVLMNPPFSSAPERMKDKTATANAKRHVEQALDRLEPDGRLVCIVGEGMADDKPAFKTWFNELRESYNIRANISLNKGAFAKYGTNYGTQLIVIDKTGPQVGQTLTGKYESLEEIPKVLEMIRNDRRTVEPETVKSRGEEVTPTTRPNRPVPSTSDGTSVTDLSSKTTEQPSTRTVSDNGTAKPNDTAADVGLPSTTTRTSGDAANTPKNTETRTPGSVSTDDGKQPQEQLSVKNKKTKKQIENEDDVYSVYTPSKLELKGAKPHMSDLVESAAMAAVDPPDVTYTPHLPQELITSGALSMAQLENIVYAGQAHSQLLPNGQRKGHFIGDGTGVGKGREIAGIIMDNFAQGRTKAVWFTMNQNLVVDAYRDWTELGNDKALMYDHSKIKAGTPINIDKGVLVSTYGMLKSGAKNNPEATRINQLVKWLGEDFDGVIVFDEAHNMANAIDNGEGLGKKKASQTGLAGIELQKRLPNARIEYVSATGATDVHNLAYLTRLGLWGQGTAFLDVNDFISKVGAGGIAAMELVARDMKAMGAYLARSISFKGVEYDTVEHNLTPMQTQIYDTMSEAWATVLDNVDKVLEHTGASKNGMAQRNAKSQFYNAIQKFYNQIITAMAMPSVVENIKKELANGNSCVIQVVNTNEAAAERQFEKMAAQNLELDELDLTPRDTLIQYLLKSFPIHEYEEYVDDNGNTRTRPVQDAEGNPVVSRKAVKKRDELIEMVEQMKVPDGPLEILLDEFGPEMVAEVTGRKRRVVTLTDKNGNRVRKIEVRTKNSGLADAAAFQEGKKRILIFSDAGGTGKSYHADRRVKNQQHRIHYLLQPGWNVFKATQGLGRTHRTNQVSAPTFRLVTTNVMGQKRFTSTIARRLDQLGALTKGQRQTGSGIFGEKDNLESPLAKDALAVFYKVLYELKGRAVFKGLGLEKKMFDEHGAFKPDREAERDTGLFLNRILALKVAEQNEIFNLYMDTFDKVFEKALEDGTVDMGLENVKADKIELSQEEVIRDKEGMQTKYVQMTVYTKPKLVPFNKTKKLYRNFQGLAIDTRTNEVRVVYRISDKTTAKGEIVAQYLLQSPMISKKSVFIEKTLEEHFAMLPQEDWKNAWEEETTKQPEYLEEQLHMLTGALLPIWDRLPEGNASVKRVMTDKGETYLGRVISPKEIDGVLKKFNLEANKKTYTMQELQTLVLDKDKVLTLTNKLKIERRRVSNEWRMELTGPNLWYYRNTYKGIFSERIASKDRYFIPIGEEGLKTLEAITKDNPVLEVKDHRTSDDDTDAFTSVNGGPQLGKATGLNTDVENTKSASELYKEFAKAFNTAILKRPNRGSLGTFYGRENIIRVKKVNDIPVLCHETGHLIDKYYKFSENGKAPYAEELERLGEATSLPSYSKTKKRREGVAEFLRLYWTDTPEAKKSSFYKPFIETISAPELETIDNLREEIWKLTNLRADERIGKTIKYYDGKPSKAPTNFETFFRQVYTGIVDENYTIEWAAGQLGGEAAKMDMRNRLGKLRGYEGIAMFDVDAKGEGSYQVDLHGKRVGESYAAIVGPVHKNKKLREAFQKYQVARRGLDYFERGLEFPETEEVCQATIKLLEKEHPEFKGIFEKLLNYRKNNLKLLVEAGLIKQETYDKILEDNPNYTPLKRDVDHYRYGTGDSRKLGANKHVVKGLKGGGQDIIDPEVNDINNTFVYRSAAMRNEILVKLADLVENSKDMGWLMSKTRLNMKMFELSQEQINSIAQQALAQLGIMTDDMDFDVLSRVFKPNFAAGPNQVLIYREGKAQLYDVAPELYETLSGLSANQSNTLIDALAYIGKLSKTGIIFTPQYIYRNAARDTLQNLIGSRSGINPLDIVGGFISAVRKDKWYHLAQKHGGTTNYFTASDQQFAKDTINDIMVNQHLAARLLHKVKHPLNTIQDMIEPTEMAGRIAEIKKTLKKHGNSQAAIDEAIYNGRDLSVDFKKAGAWVKKLQLNRMINFFNAQIQGEVKDVKLLFNRKTSVKTILRALTYLTAPTLALWWMNKDNENYQELPSYRKDYFFNVPIGDPKTTKLFFLIPRPFGLGTIFAALPERLLEKEYRENPRAFMGFGETLQQAWGVPLMPSAITPIYEVKTNRDWRNIPILNQGDENQKPYLQYNQYTSETSKAIAKVTKDIPGMPDMLQSPKQLDHLIKGYTGTLGSMALSGIDALTGKSDRNPLSTIGSSFIADASKRPETINLYYEYKKRVDLDYAESMLNGTKLEKPHVREIFKRVNTALNKNREKVDKLEAVPESKEKEAMLQQLRDEEIALMRIATNLYEQEYLK